MRKNVLLLTVLTVILLSCNEQNPVRPVQDHDVVTTVTLTLAASTGTDTLRYTWLDRDGSVGSLLPKIDVVRLKASTYYKGTVQLYSEQLINTKDLTPTIRTEQESHQFLFSDDKGLVVFAITDKDTNNKPVGLDFTAYTSKNTGQSTLSVRLYHYDQPNEKTAGIPGPETDVSVDFPLIVE